MVDAGTVDLPANETIAAVYDAVAWLLNIWYLFISITLNDGVFPSVTVHKWRLDLTSKGMD